MATSGLVTMTPSSIASTGTGNSSSINTNGSVTFSTCATLSLNGVFTSSYDNYMIQMRGTASANVYLEARMRVGGVDEASTSNYYTYQVLYADGTTVAGSRLSNNEGRLANIFSTRRWGFTTNIYGPYLAQPTAYRTVTALDYLSAYIEDYAGTHSLSTSYDGLTFMSSSGSFTGLVTVYGFNQ
jgi:hypothetical protein